MTPTSSPPWGTIELRYPVPNILAGLNPITRIALMILLATPLLLSVDWVSAAISLAITLALAPLCGMPWPRLLRSSWFLFIIAPLSGISMLLYGAPGGEVYFQWWLMVVSDNSIELAVAIMLRVLAVALPMVVLSRDIDPTRLGDSLAQVLHLPARFVIGAIAGVRMVTLFKDDWAFMSMARRARGLSDQGRIRHTMTMSFGLLVLALRRGGKLATAMEARGFGRTPPGGGARTWARPSRLHRRDLVALCVGIVLTAIPIVVAVLSGSWRFFGL